MSKYKKAIDYLQPIADNAELSGCSEALVVAMDALWEMDKLCSGRENADKVYRAALNTFGAESQFTMLFEEIGELMAAICQYSRGRDKLSHVAEEIADVGIMLEQMAILFMCEDEVERMRRYKLRRLEQRVEEYKGKENMPLTREELQGMIGEPVWIVDKIKGGSSYWAIASETMLGLFGGYDAYRSKPVDHFPESTKMVEEVEQSGRE